MSKYMPTPPKPMPAIDRRPRIEGKLLDDSDIGRSVRHKGHSLQGVVAERNGFLVAYGNYGSVLVQFADKPAERCATNNLKWNRERHIE